MLLAENTCTCLIIAAGFFSLWWAALAAPSGFSPDLDGGGAAAAAAGPWAVGLPQVPRGSL